MAIALAIISSIMWGTSDFIGGTVSKRLPSSTVLLWSSLAALPVIAAVAVVTGNVHFSGTTVGWGIVAGVSCSLGIVALYQALATGVMGVVAPIASTSVLVPVLVGFARGEGPGPVRSAGIALAIIGVILAGGPHLRLFRTGGHRPIILALIAAIGIGISLLAVANGSSDNAIGTLLVMRLVYPVLLLVVVIITRAPRVAGRGNVRPAAAAGIGDALAVMLYGVATRSGSLPVVAALSSLFPVTTLFLARQIDHERLEREQAIGVALAIVGVIIVVTSAS